MQSNKAISALLFIIVVFIGGVILHLAKPILFPFFLAIFLSFVLYPALDFLTRIKVPRIIAIIVIILLTFFILYLLGALFYSAGKTFAAEFPRYGNKINSILTDFLARLDLERFRIENINWIGQLDIDRMGRILGSSLGPFISFISNLFLVLIFLIFIMSGRGKTKKKINKSLDQARASRIIHVIKNIDNQIQRYLVIKTIVSLFTGIFVTVVLLFFKVDFAVVFGFLAFLLNYIPNIGSIIATALPVVIAFFQFDSTWTAFWIMIFLILIQMVMANVVEPKLMGHGLGLSPLVVLFFLFFWGWLWGLPGMILAVPIAAIIKIVCTNVPELEIIAALMSKD
jgi:AI-2 transport protein TqsA